MIHGDAKDGYFSEVSLGAPPAGLWLDPAFRDRIGRQLRDIYRKLVQAQVPDRLLELLDRLQESEEGAATGRSRSPPREASRRHPASS